MLHRLKLWHVQAHHVTRQVEYQGDVVTLTEALVGLPAGGQILLSDAIYQRVYGRLHTLKYKGQLQKITSRTKRKLGKDSLLTVIHAM